MLDATLIGLPLNDLKEIFFEKFSIYHFALIYVLMFVIYKCIGRYVYFKDQEHSSKVNRTFLSISILVIILNSFNYNFFSFLPFFPESQWLYSLIFLTILISLSSMTLYRIMFVQNSGEHHFSYRGWSYDKIPVTSGNEDYRYRMKNVNSDAMLHIISLCIFLVTSFYWAYKSYLQFGYTSIIFNLICVLFISAIYIDEAVFSWVELVQRRHEAWKKIAKERLRNLKIN